MAGNRPKSHWGRRVWQTLLALLLVLAAAAGVYVYRSLPKLDGAITAAGLSAPVQVQRDAADVAHISAQTPRDAWFGLGWVHAQERGWQLEFNRRVMRGELSEVLGEATLDTDKLLRTLGILRTARAQLAGAAAGGAGGAQGLQRRHQHVPRHGRPGAAARVPRAGCEAGWGPAAWRGRPKTVWAGRS